jgi:hypothetical protein
LFNSIIGLDFSVHTSLEIIERVLIDKVDLVQITSNNFVGVSIALLEGELVVLDVIIPILVTSGRGALAQVCHEGQKYNEKKWRELPEHQREGVLLFAVLIVLSLVPALASPIMLTLLLPLSSLLGLLE